MKRFSRREFLKLSAAALSAKYLLSPIAVESSFASSLNLVPPAHSNLPLSVEEFEIQLELDKAFNNYKIGFLTDTHYGFAIERDFLKQSADVLEELDLDLLLLGGDYAWIADSKISTALPIERNSDFARSKVPSSELALAIIKELAEVLGKVPARDGRYGVLGNHDNWLLSKSAVRNTFSAAGIELLVNKEVLIDKGGTALSLFGCDDYWTGLPKLPPARKNQARLFLSHNPDMVASCPSERFDLALCGHTHGGQIHFPVLGALAYNIRNSQYGIGSAPLGQALVYTSRGTGVVELPWRYNCAPEISLITIRC